MEAIEPAYGATTLLLIAAGAVALLLFLIIRVKLHAFVALVLVSLLTALAAGAVSKLAKLVEPKMEAEESIYKVEKDDAVSTVTTSL